jgi:hypothetical protein
MLGGFLKCESRSFWLDTIPFQDWKEDLRPDRTRQVASKDGNELAAICRHA